MVGFEPTAYRLTADRSNHWSYTSYIVIESYL